ncbi:hypothetical protein PMAYCL1PPCAC_05564, partial [Pristionchus mayeri]
REHIMNLVEMSKNGWRPKKTDEFNCLDDSRNMDGGHSTANKTVNDKPTNEKLQLELAKVLFESQEKDRIIAELERKYKQALMKVRR